MSLQEGRADAAMLGRWRRQHERDLKAFELAHGRQPDNHYELSLWLKRKPPKAAKWH
jgi:hypothetical protein